MRLAVLFLMMANVHSMDRVQRTKELLAARSTEKSVSESEDTRALLQKKLAPLKKDALFIQEKVALFHDALVRQKKWNDTVLKRAFLAYQELDDLVDVFSIIHQRSFMKIKSDYRLDRDVDEVMHEHVLLFREGTFALEEYRKMIFDLTNADRVFKDVRSRIRSPHVPFSTLWVDTLKKYQQVSFCHPEYAELQTYLNETAQDLLRQLREEGLHKDGEERVKVHCRVTAVGIKVERERKKVLKKVTFEERGLEEVSDQKVAQQNGEKKQEVEDRWFLAEARKKWLVPQIPIG